MGLNFRGRRGVTTLAAAAVAVAGAGAAIGVAATSGGDDPQEAFADALSDQVGTEVTAEDLQAAREQVAKERLDEAVASGRITQEEADEMLQRLQELPEMREKAQAAREASQAPIAEALGVTTEELHEARHDGTTLLELAEEKGVSREDLEAAVKKGIQAGASASGRTAPTGEDLEDMVDRIVEREGRGGPGPGRGHGRGGPGGFGGPLGP